MSETKEDGGPAFPRPAAEHSLGGHHEQSGMSLRDWFAGQALMGSMAHTHDFETATKRQVAVAMYEMADAMLAARSTP